MKTANGWLNHSRTARQATKAALPPIHRHQIQVSGERPHPMDRIANDVSRILIELGSPQGPISVGPQQGQNDFHQDQVRGRCHKEDSEQENQSIVQGHRANRALPRTTPGPANWRARPGARPYGQGELLMLGQLPSRPGSPISKTVALHDRDRALVSTAARLIAL